MAKCPNCGKVLHFLIDMMPKKPKGSYRIFCRHCHKELAETGKSIAINIVALMAIFMLGVIFRPPNAGGLWALFLCGLALAEVLIWWYCVVKLVEIPKRKK